MESSRLMCQLGGSTCEARITVQLDRLIYSPIDRRPRLQWPNGARVALWLVPNVEHYEYLPRKGQLRDPWPRMPHPDVLGYSRADYGNRIGIWRTFEAIDRYQMPCTVSLNLAVYEHFPKSCKPARRASGKSCATASTTPIISGACRRRKSGRSSPTASQRIAVSPGVSCRAGSRPPVHGH